MITLYGATAFFPSGSDASRHLLSVNEHYISLTISQFFSESVNILQLKPDEGVQDDLFIHCLSFVAGFFGWPRLLYIIVSFLYGYLLVNSLFLVLEDIRFRSVGFLLGFYILFLILWKNVEGINSIRNHTGAWLLFFAYLKYVSTKKRKFLLLLIVSPLVHFQYLLMLPFVILGYFLSKFKVIVSVLFVISLFVQLPKSVLASQLQKTSLGQKKEKAYVKEAEYWKERSQSLEGKRHFYTNAARSNTIYNTIIIIALGLVIVSQPKISNRGLELNCLLSSGLLLGIIGNLLSYVPSIYSRVYQLVGLFILSALILYLSKFRGGKHNWFDQAFKVVLYMLLYPTGIILLFKLSIILEYASIYLLALTILPVFITDINISIKGIIDLII